MHRVTTYTNKIMKMENLEKEKLYMDGREISEEELYELTHAYDDLINN